MTARLRWFQGDGEVGGGHAIALDSDSQTGAILLTAPHPGLFGNVWGHFWLF